MCSCDTHEHGIGSIRRYRTGFRGFCVKVLILGMHCIDIECQMHIFSHERLSIIRNRLIGWLSLSSLRKVELESSCFLFRHLLDFQSMQGVPIRTWSILEDGAIVTHRAGLITRGLGMKASCPRAGDNGSCRTKFARQLQQSLLSGFRNFS